MAKHSNMSLFEANAKAVDDRLEEQKRQIILKQNECSVEIKNHYDGVVSVSRTNDRVFLSKAPKARSESF